MLNRTNEPKTNSPEGIVKALDANEKASLTNQLSEEEIQRIEKYRIVGPFERLHSDYYQLMLKKVYFDYLHLIAETPAGSLKRKRAFATVSKNVKQILTDRSQDLLAGWLFEHSIAYTDDFNLPVEVSNFL